MDHAHPAAVGISPWGKRGEGEGIFPRLKGQVQVKVPAEHSVVAAVDFVGIRLNGPPDGDPGNDLNVRVAAGGQAALHHLDRSFHPGLVQVPALGLNMGQAMENGQAGQHPGGLSPSGNGELPKKQGTAQQGREIQQQVWGEQPRQAAALAQHRQAKDGDEHRASRQHRSREPPPQPGGQGAKAQKQG